MTDTTTKQEAPRQKHTRLTNKQWAEATALWELGDVTLQDLSEKFGPAPETFSRKFKKLGVKRGSKAKEHAKEIKKAVQEASVDETAVRATRAKKTKDDHYKWSEVISKAAMGEYLKAMQEGRAVSTTLPNLKALDKIMDILKKARDERWIVLGLDKDDVGIEDLPDLIIRELTADQIAELRDGGMDDAVDENAALLEDLLEENDIVVTDGGD